MTTFSVKSLKKDIYPKPKKRGGFTKGPGIIVKNIYGNSDSLLQDDAFDYLLVLICDDSKSIYSLSLFDIETVIKNTIKEKAVFKFYPKSKKDCKIYEEMNKNKINELNKKYPMCYSSDKLNNIVQKNINIMAKEILKNTSSF